MKMENKLHKIFWDGDPHLGIDNNVVMLTFEPDEDMDYIFETFNAAITENPKVLKSPDVSEDQNVNKS